MTCELLSRLLALCVILCVTQASSSVQDARDFEEKGKETFSGPSYE